MNVFAVRDGSVDGYPNAREAGTRSDLKQFPFPESHAEAARDHVVKVVATKADIARLEDRMATKADLYRALWVQTGIIAGIILGSFGGIVVALINLFPS